MLKLFYRAKWLKHEKKNNMFPFCASLLSMILCMVCLAGTTWSWFTASQEVRVDRIAAGNREVQRVEVYAFEDSLLLLEDTAEKTVRQTSATVDVTVEGNAFSFEVMADTPYLVFPSVESTVNNGYLQVKTCDGDFYTTELVESFRLLLSQDSTVTISASWGTYYGDAVPFSEKEVIGKGTLSVDEREEEEILTSALVEETEETSEVTEVQTETAVTEMETTAIEEAATAEETSPPETSTEVETSATADLMESIEETKTEIEETSEQQTE